MTPRSSKRALTRGQRKEKIPTKRLKTFGSLPSAANEVDSSALVKLENMDEGSHDTLPKSRSTLSLKDLPPSCQHDFRSKFRPAVRDFVGTIGPWEFPAEKDIARIWNVCFPRHQLRASKSLYTIVSKLVDDTIKRWRWQIATKAVECVNTYLRQISDKPSVRVAHAALLLGDDEKDRKRPFYYRKYENGAQPCGIFQSPIIAATLATHLSSISALPEESRLPDYPAGALALSVLAVKRALMWAKAGAERIPKTSEGNFSRVNWGDHYGLQDGRYVFVKTAGNIVAVIAKLHDAQWDRILAEADRYAAKNMLKAVQEEEEENQSDFELEDWDDEFDRSWA